MLVKAHENGSVWKFQNWNSVFLCFSERPALHLSVLLLPGVVKREVRRLGAHIPRLGRYSSLSTVRAVDAKRGYQDVCNVLAAL